MVAASRNATLALAIDAVRPIDPATRAVASGAIMLMILPQLKIDAAARDLAGAALGLSLDAAATVFEMAGIVAGLAPAPREASPARR